MYVAFIDPILAVLGQKCTCLCEWLFYVRISIAEPLNSATRVDTFGHRKRVASPCRSD